MNCFADLLKKQNHAYKCSLSWIFNIISGKMIKINRKSQVSKILLLFSNSTYGYLDEEVTCDVKNIYVRRYSSDIENINIRYWEYTTCNEWLWCVLIKLYFKKNNSCCYKHLYKLMFKYTSLGGTSIILSTTQNNIFKIIRWYGNCL